MKVEVDATLCEGVGFCAEIDPATFDASTAPPTLVRHADVTDDRRQAVYEAEQMCPVRAIVISK
ncbi:ferredoxin [Mycobacterium sp. NAZ190054]|uniref:ferredoxin n=1 Tax=Mycobacterium sp. NAZ190054 TaxID=1747766 RepID=UPI0007934427|nr:ferredoxin [Mycobacterium sp. NAZ190054]KWX68390.1 hypothetical protein ASJ79_03145 [Mycobacterium sp. NAZ190054]